jgi:hypothetical protein
MHLYTGLRQKGAELLWRVPCVKVETIVIWEDGLVWTMYGNPLRGGISDYGWQALETASPKQIRDRYGFEAMGPAEREKFARRDGFANWETMYRFWRTTHQLPFYGGIWHWDYEKRTKEKP